jgi:hypothetical protein
MDWIQEAAPVMLERLERAERAEALVEQHEQTIAAVRSLANDGTEDSHLRLVQIIDMTDRRVDGAAPPQMIVDADGGVAAYLTAAGSLWTQSDPTKRPKVGAAPPEPERTWATEVLALYDPAALSGQQDTEPEEKV